MLKVISEEIKEAKVSHSSTTMINKIDLTIMYHLDLFVCWKIVFFMENELFPDV
jgi:hypothetical protein